MNSNTKKTKPPHQTGSHYTGSFRQLMKPIFGMQPYFNPTRWNKEDNLNVFENGRQPQLFLMEDDLNLFEKRRPQIFS